MPERERDTETETETERQADRQTDMQTDKQKESVERQHMESKLHVILRNNRSSYLYLYHAVLNI